MAAPEIPIFEVGPDMHKGEPELHLQLVSERMTAEELIRARVAREVERYNADESGTFVDFERNAVEKRLNANRDRIDVAKQMDQAVRAFTKNRYMLFVDDRQVEELDEVLLLNPQSEVLFVRLVPLAGG